jgi:hypothetical protein
MNQKSNQSKEQLDSELPTKVLPEETLFALCKAEIHEVSRKLKKNIEKQCDAKGVESAKLARSRNTERRLAPGRVESSPRPKCARSRQSTSRD